MKKSQLIEIIQKAIKPIIEKTIHRVIKEELNNYFTSLETTNQVQEQKTNNQLTDIMSQQPTNKQQKTLLKKKYYSSDKILNNILNDTASNITENEFNDDDSIDNKGLPHSVLDNPQLTSKLGNALNRDYSKLIKKIDEKKHFRP